MTYNPDAWVIIKITTKKHGVVYKLLTGWYGGFAGSDSWRLNSGIEKINLLNNNHYQIVGFSGTVYEVNPNCCRMSALMQQVYSEFVSDIVAIGGTIEILDIESAIKELGELDDHS